MLTTLTTDLRFAVRMLRRSPVFTIVAVLVIALGTGAVTTIFSALNALVLRPLPGITRGDRVVGLEMLRPEGEGQMRATLTIVERIAARTRTLSGIAGWNRASVSVAMGQEGVAANGIIVTGNYFTVLGVRPALGRFFLPEEDRTPLTHPVAVLSHAFWSTRLGGDSAVVGRVVSVNGAPFTVIGVASEDFIGAMPIVPDDIYVPFMMDDALRPERAPVGTKWVRPLARLKDGVTMEAAEREVSALLSERAADLAELPADRQFTATRLAMVRAVPEDARGGFQGFLSVLLGASVLVMLIASVNVASMLSARAVVRRREMALRTALGAVRLRLVRQLLTESLLLFALGAAGGMSIAYVTTTALERLRLPLDRSPVLEISPDPRALAFALAVALVTGVAFGLAPALRASRQDITSRLRDDSAGAGSRRSFMANALIIGQLAASLVLLVSAGLFIRALNNGRQVDPGFDATGVVTMSLIPESWGYNEVRTRIFATTLRETVAAMPGVTAVSYSNLIPMSASGTGANITIDGRDDPAVGERPAGVPIRLMTVDADYFAVLQLPLLSGRAIGRTDDERAPYAAVVNETLARRFWPEGNALGRMFMYREHHYAVVGVARDAKYESLDEVTPPVVYFPLAQEWQSSRFMLVRSTVAAEQLAPALQRAVRSIDPALPLPTVATMESANAVVLLPQRIAAIGTGLMGGIGLLMATVGLYGIISYSVNRRTREIGIRVALGARKSQVLGMIVREGLRLTSAGVAIGLLLAAGATRFLSKFLFNVSPLDALTFASMSALFVVVAVLASLLPARRAAATNPMTALRTE